MVTVRPLVRACVVVAALALWAAVPGCKPDLGDDDALVASARALVVTSTPAEAKPGDVVTYRVLLADPTGTRVDVPVRWAHCVEPKPLSAPGPILAACLAEDGSALAQLGPGIAVSGKIPDNACRQFGPNPPDAKPGEPSGRPADPDASGGYYQPVRARIGAVEDPAAPVALGTTRLSCGLTGVTQETGAAFTRRYRSNVSPVAVVELDGAALPEAATGDTVRVRRGQKVTFTARWAACPSVDTCGDGVCGIDDDPSACAADCAPVRGCTGAERYLWLDPATRELAPRREAIRIAWFANGGHFDEPRTGRAEDDGATSSANGWTAPSSAGPITLWVVARDDRGGASFSAHSIVVE